MDPGSTDSNYYSVLQCPETATVDDIRRNYKKLALKCHPDKNPEIGAESSFAVLNQAAKTLSDETERFKYDSQLLERHPETAKIITDELMIDDLMNDPDDGDVLYYECRCGGQYVLKRMTNNNRIITTTTVVDCNTCSLSIQIKNS